MRLSRSWRVVSWESPGGAEGGTPTAAAAGGAGWKGRAAGMPEGGAG